MVTIPEGVNVEIRESVVKVKGPKGELEKKFSSKTRITAGEHEISVESDDPACKGTVESLINSMINGVKTGFQKKLKIIYAHFPIALEIKGKDIIIKNFQGEKQPRKTAVIGHNTKVEVKGQEVTISGPDKEAVGQTAANLRTATKIKNKDPRVFQDGIYVLKVTD